MFDRLEELVDKLDTINNQLTDPDVVSDQNKFRKLMKEQSDLSPIVEKYHEYKDAKTTIEDSLEILEEESDEELREMAKEEMNEAKANLETIEQELKILLLPKDPNDSKNVIVEIRAGAGGDEAALFAAEVYRMYVHYADSRRWKTEMISLNENGIGGSDYGDDDLLMYSETVDVNIRFGKNDDITELIYDKTQTGSGKNKVVVQMLNRETGEYDTVFADGQTIIKGQELDKYMSDGCLAMRFISPQQGDYYVDSYLPHISARGGVR